jgi:hypothetical protein
MFWRSISLQFPLVWPASSKRRKKKSYPERVAKTTQKGELKEQA